MEFIFSGIHFLKKNYFTANKPGRAGPGLNGRKDDSWVTSARKEK